MSVYELWLPILAAGIAVHVACTIAWTVLPHHKPEWPILDGDKDPTNWLKEHGVAPGQYVINWMGDESACGGTVIIWDKKPNMGANIGLTLAFFMLSSFTIGYLASIALGPGAASMDVFRFTATVGLLTYAACGLTHVIWFRRKILLEVIDGVVFAMITGGVFAALWPAAAG